MKSKNAKGYPRSSEADLNFECAIIVDDAAALVEAWSKLSPSLDPQERSEKLDASLAEACDNMKADVIKALIGLGAKERDGEALLARCALMMMPATLGHPDRSIESLGALLAAGVDIDGQLGSVPGEQGVPKKYANQSYGVAGWQSGRGGFEGATALMVACCKGRLDVANMLVGAGASLQTRDDKGATPLHRCAEPNKGSEAVGLAILAAGADPNALDNGNRPPMVHAMHYGLHHLSVALFEAGADLWHDDGFGNSPISMLRRSRDRYPYAERFEASASIAEARKLEEAIGQAPASTKPRPRV